jgi:hypothetical protein
MGLFSKKNKKKVPKKVDSSIPIMPNIPINTLDIPPAKEESISDNDIKKAIKIDLPEKKEFNTQQVNEDIKYIDEILDNDFNLNSNEIKDATINQNNSSFTEDPKKEIIPEIKKEAKILNQLSQNKFDSPSEKPKNFDEIVHINVENDELKPIDKIKPILTKFKQEN